MKNRLIFRSRRAVAAMSCWLALTAAPVVAQVSAFGCEGLSGGHRFASVEGQDGVFFRVNPDLRNNLVMADPVIAQLSALSEALAAGGTTLILAPVPTKALAMPGHLTANTDDFGYDADIAATIYLDNLRRMRTAGLHVAQTRAALLRTKPLPYFETDPRLTSAGARAMTRAIAAAIEAIPGQDTLAKHAYDSAATGTSLVSSVQHAALQQRCQQVLPEVRTETFETRLTEAAPEDQVGVTALVGTEYSNTPEVNFDGFLAQETGHEILQYSVEGGGAFAAISTYLTSREFQLSRPDALVWEYPVSDNPGAKGLLALQELIAAARNQCSFEVTLTRSDDTPRLFTGDLSNLPEGPPPVLLADFDAQTAQNARFRFLNSDGEVLTRRIARLPAQLPTGRFYMPTAALWPEGAIKVEVTSDGDLGPNPRLFACDGGGI